MAGPLPWGHGFTKLNSCLSSTSVDRRYPKKTQVPERQRLKMLLEPGLLAGPFPFGHGGITHGFTKLNSCLSFTSVDRRYPKNTSPRKTKVENAFRARAFGRPSSLGPRRNTHGFTKLNSCQLLRLVRSLAVLLLLTYFSLTLCSFHLGRRASLLG